MFWYTLTYDEPVVEEAKPYTQKQIDDMITSRLKKERDLRVTMEQELASTRELLEASAKQEQMSEEERKKHKEALEALKRKNETEAERYAREQQELKEKYETELTTTNEKLKSWQSRFTDQFVRSEIAKHATHPDHEVVDVQTMFELLGYRTQVMPVKDEEGNDVPDAFEAVISGVEVPDKTGKTQVKDLPIAEAFKVMNNNPRYFSLFKNRMKKGTGIEPNTPGSETPDAKLSMSEYIAKRKSNSLSWQKEG